MNETKKRYQVTIMSAIDELQRVYRGLNRLYFNETLEDVIITIQTDPRRCAYAWISVAKTWNDKSENWYHEINIVAEWLNRDPADVCASLLHEMCHLWNMQQGVQDCSRGGTYHNEKFRDTALSHGLTCAKGLKYGWTITGPTEELKKWVNANVRKGCFRFQKVATWADGTPKKTGDDSGTSNIGKPNIEKKGKSNIIKYVCPKCGLIIRASKNIDYRLVCWTCTAKAWESNGKEDEPVFMMRGK